MKKNVRVAVCQINVTNSIQKNRDKILDFIDKAARKRADIACFPECSTIHDEKLIIKNKYTIANEIKNTIESISKKCAEKKIWCIFGTYIT